MTQSENIPLTIAQIARILDLDADGIDRVKLIGRLGHCANKLEMSQQDLVNRFNAWLATTVYSFEDGVQRIEDCAATGLPLPWQMKVGDGDKWTPKKNIAPVSGVKAQMPACCASCAHLVDKPQLGLPECNRPNGPIFPRGDYSALLTRCKKYRCDEKRDLDHFFALIGLQTDE